MEAAVDNDAEKITMFALLLSGEELTYPEIVGEIEFGATSMEQFDWTYEWPTEEDLANLDILTVQEDLRFSQMRYKQFEGDKELSGIQLVFQNGIETPWYEITHEITPES